MTDLYEALHGFIDNWQVISASIMGNILCKSAAVDFGVQWALWVLAAALRTEKFYDLAGSGTFIALAYLSRKWNDTFFSRQNIQTSCVMLWAFRLGMYLFVRVMKEGEDKRFTHVRGRPAIFFVYWTMQAIWVFVTLLPSLILNSKTVDRPLGWRDYAGWSIWAVGFLTEVLADYQKSVFRNNPENKGKFISSGLWSLSRHPNYFGEILLWFGLYLSASSTFRHRLEHLSVLSPMFVYFLITKVSGVPPLEKMAMKRFGKDPAYQQYVKDTPVLIPFLNW
ncbi:uncharacterized protein LOC141911959 [Tubulanus polymorphus]|uniref:uncharacterized protein LOC141911959 n=1 Tax=Tubulanus polymorphus TaxID=672921 RepID=UPI003DA5E231